MNSALMMHHVFFRVSNVNLALPASAVLEILPCPVLERTPGMASLIGGLFRLDGQSAVALRLDRLLGLNESPVRLYSPLIRLRDAPHPCAVIVDEVQDVAVAGAVRPTGMRRSFNDAVVGEIDRADRVWHVLSAERLLLIEEQQALAEFAVRATDRIARLQPA
jgi:purine-binding chemotaxis protein CheW